MIERARLREVLRLALPIIGGMVSQNVLNLVDTAMVGTLGPTALAAVGQPLDSLLHGSGVLRVTQPGEDRQAGGLAVALAHFRPRWRLHARFGLVARHLAILARAQILHAEKKGRT